MKLLVSLGSKSIEDYLNYTNSFILGIKDFSVNYLEFSIDEIKELLEKYKNIELFVALNKNIFNPELDNLEKTLVELDKLNLKGILFYDLAVLSIHERLNLKTPLVFHQTHMVTNYNTCNLYYDKGCEYSVTSNEITSLEISEIKDKTKQKLMTMFLGMPIVSHSRRSLLSNYLEYKNLKKEKENYVIKSGDSPEYIIRENGNKETSIIYKNIINGSEPMMELKGKIEYGILNEFLMDHELFMKLLPLFSKLNKDVDVEKNRKLIKDLIGEDTGFFYKKTIYKVKRGA